MSREFFWTAERIDEIASERARIVGPSVWAAAQPDGRKLISFAGGLPDIPSLPGEVLERAAHRVIATDRKEALQYGGTFGTLPLREELARRSTMLEGVDIGSDQVVVVSGSAHGIGLMCETLVNPGDAVLIESPSFPGSIRTIRSFGPEIIGVPLDGEGLQVDQLEATLAGLERQGRRAKFLYCIPTHQNPAGVTLTPARREKLIELVRRFNTLVIEDDAYGELWFEEPPPRSLFALSGGDHVVKISSFSKILATGLRMGWSMGPPALMSRIAATRFDMGSSVFLGRVLAEAIRSGDLDEHVPRLRSIYKRKRDRMEEALRTHCGEYVKWASPGGGFFLWLELPPGIPAPDVQTAALERGVVVGGGPQYFAGTEVGNNIRLAFSYVATEDIEEGCHLLGEAIADIAARAAAK